MYILRRLGCYLVTERSCGDNANAFSNDLKGKKMNLLFTIKNIFEILQTLFKEERDFDNHGTNALKVTVFQFLLARTCTLFFIM